MCHHSTLTWHDNFVVWFYHEPWSTDAVMFIGCGQKRYPDRSLTSVSHNELLDLRHIELDIRIFELKRGKNTTEPHRAGLAVQYPTP